jgi:HK97 family phage prohead protease
MNLTGVACKTDHGYEMPFYVETIKRGAFAKTLAEAPDVALLINHSGLPLARTLSGTLNLRESSAGLVVDADLADDDPDVRALAPKLRRGDVDQMSFSFRVVRQKWDDSYTRRDISEVNIHRGDVSVVTQGANDATTVSMRSSIAAAAGRSGVPERRRLATEIGDLGVVEMRMVELDGQRLVLGGHRRAKGDDCNRCQGDGTINITGTDIVCPLCGGTGTGEANAIVDDNDGDEAARSLYAPLAMYDARARLAALESRAKYDAHEIDAMGAKGEAFKNSDGSYSFPIADAEDVRNAVRATGRSGSDHNAVRAYIIKRARQLGALDAIPSTWNSDGSLSGSRALANELGFDVRLARWSTGGFVN